MWMIYLVKNGWDKEFILRKLNEKRKKI